MLFICLALCLLQTAQSDPFDPSYSYDQFMVHFKRNYVGEEKLNHEMIFNINYL